MTLVPGKALNFGNCRSTISVRLLGGRIVQATAATEINAEDVAVGIDENRQAYVWGGSTPQFTGVERTLVRRSQPKKKEELVYPFKGLGEIEGKLRKYGDSQDREIELGDWIGFLNLGKKKTDFVVWFSDSDDYLWRYLKGDLIRFDDKLTNIDKYNLWYPYNWDYKGLILETNLIYSRGTLSSSDSHDGDNIVNNSTLSNYYYPEANSEFYITYGSYNSPVTSNGNLTWEKITSLESDDSAYIHSETVNRNSSGTKTQTNNYTITHVSEDWAVNFEKNLSFTKNSSQPITRFLVGWDDDILKDSGTKTITVSGARTETFTGNAVSEFSAGEVIRLNSFTGCSIPSSPSFTISVDNSYTESLTETVAESCGISITSSITVNHEVSYSKSFTGTGEGTIISTDLTFSSAYLNSTYGVYVIDAEITITYEGSFSNSSTITQTYTTYKPMLRASKDLVIYSKMINNYSLTNTIAYDTHKEKSGQSRCYILHSGSFPDNPEDWDYTTSYYSFGSSGEPTDTQFNRLIELIAINTVKYGTYNTSYSKEFTNSVLVNSYPYPINPVDKIDNFYLADDSTNTTISVEDDFFLIFNHFSGIESYNVGQNLVLTINNVSRIGLNEHSNQYQYLVSDSDSTIPVGSNPHQFWTDIINRDVIAIIGNFKVTGKVADLAYTDETIGTASVIRTITEMTIIIAAIETEKFFCWHNYDKTKSYVYPVDRNFQIVRAYAENGLPNINFNDKGIFISKTETLEDSTKEQKKHPVDIYQWNLADATFKRQSVKTGIVTKSKVELDGVNSISYYPN